MNMDNVGVEGGCGDIVLVVEDLRLRMVALVDSVRVVVDDLLD